MKNIQGIKKIINLGEDELDEYDFSVSIREPYIGRVLADVFIYYYEYECYSGTGIAIWRNKKGEWAYQYLGHCSCNGPLEDIETSDKAKFTLEQIKEILNSNSEDYYKIILNYLNKYKK